MSVKVNVKAKGHDIAHCTGYNARITCQRRETCARMKKTETTHAGRPA